MRARRVLASALGPWLLLLLVTAGTSCDPVYEDQERMIGVTASPQGDIIVAVAVCPDVQVESASVEQVDLASTTATETLWEVVAEPSAAGGSFEFTVGRQPPAPFIEKLALTDPIASEESLTATVRTSVGTGVKVFSPSDLVGGVVLSGANTYNSVDDFVAHATRDC